MISNGQTRRHLFQSPHYLLYRDLLEILQLLAAKTETATTTGIGIALVANVVARMSSEPVAIEDSLTRSLHHSFKLDDKMANHTFF